MLFTTSSGGPSRRVTLYTAWRGATRSVGITGLRFHDLRHTGNTLAAAIGASTKELMSRMGQSSLRAALVYQYATQDRDAVIADSLSVGASTIMRTEHARDIGKYALVSSPSAGTDTGLWGLFFSRSDVC